jgi:hypothetical protein
MTPHTHEYKAERCVYGAERKRHLEFSSFIYEFNDPAGVTPYKNVVKLLYKILNYDNCL